MMKTAKNREREEREKALIYQFNPLHKNWRRMVEAVVQRGCGYSFSFTAPLFVMIRFGDGQRHGELANLLGIEAPSLVRTVAELETQNFLVRRDTPDDRRAKTLHLTETGRALGRIVDELLTNFRTTILSEISDRDIDAGIKIFRQMEAALQTYENQVVATAQSTEKQGLDSISH
ncbi:MarR family winged helix-turn-helix transcriptional regulator [Caballeronia sp. DA-9]|uniref:MarR family winged helix-turn-helix transcriptional regulator n=1 Tax=Caballeronia sp. DA-9 TaxID=3436237 RepID=UPI003F66D4AE